MAYEMTNWEGREGSDLDRFEKANETVKSVLLRNRPNAVTRKGTPFSAQNMNKIERGIYDAHVTAEAEANERKAADRAHNEDLYAHPDIRTIINQLIGLPVWDPGNHAIIFTAKDGSTLEVDLPLEDLARDIDFDPATKEIILIKHDGTEIRIDVGDLVDVYTGSLGTHIQITVGEDNQINALLRGGSITEAELSAALQAKINGKLDAGAQAADSAKLGGQLPGSYAKQADTSSAIADLQRQINALTPAGLENVRKYTFVIDSNAKLRQWADNAAGNDYSRVLVRAGTWYYEFSGEVNATDLRVIDLSNGRTKSVDCEAGGSITMDINFSALSAANHTDIKAVAGSEKIVINNLNIYVNLESAKAVTASVFYGCHRMRNLNARIDVNANYGQASAFANCSRIYGCTGYVDSYFQDRENNEDNMLASAFANCTLLYDCEAESRINAGSAYPFYNCRTGFGNRGRGNNRGFYNCYMEQVSGNTAWANTAAGGYNYNLTA